MRNSAAPNSAAVSNVAKKSPLVTRFTHRSLGAAQEGGIVANVYEEKVKVAEERLETLQKAYDEYIRIEAAPNPYKNLVGLKNELKEHANMLVDGKSDAMRGLRSAAKLPKPPKTYELIYRAIALLVSRPQAKYDDVRKNMLDGKLNEKLRTNLRSRVDSKSHNLRDDVELKRLMDELDNLILTDKSVKALSPPPDLHGNIFERVLDETNVKHLHLTILMFRRVEKSKGMMNQADDRDGRTAKEQQQVSHRLLLVGLGGFLRLNTVWL